MAQPYGDIHYCTKNCDSNEYTFSLLGRTWLSDLCVPTRILKQLERLEHDAGDLRNFGLNGLNHSYASLKYLLTLFDLNLKQIFLGNYIYWESNKHLELMVEKYFKVSSKPLIELIEWDLI